MVNRKSIVEEMTKLCFINQFMLYLKLDELDILDHDILGKAMIRNNHLEFKHIIYLILHDEILTSNELKTKCNTNFKWCYNIERDFEYKP